MALNTADMTPEEVGDFYEKQKQWMQEFQKSISTPEGMAAYDKRVADRWADIQNHRNGYESSDDWIDSIGNSIIDAAPYVMAVVAVAATAGAGTAALGAATTAGETVAAAGAAGAAGMDAAVTSAVGAAATTSATAAAAVASIPTVVVTGSAAAAGGALSGTALLGAIGAGGAAVAFTGGAGSTADIPGSSYQSANYGDGDTGYASGSGGDPAMQTVTVTGHAPEAAGLSPGAMAIPSLPMLSSVGGGGTNIPESDLPPLVQPTLNPMDPVPDSDVHDPNSNWVKDFPNVPSGNPNPSLPSTGTTNSGNSGLPSWLAPAAAGAALATFMSGLKDAPANPALAGDISKLNGQGDAQMSEWNNWMFPTLKDALATNKAAATDYLNASNTNAGKMEGMGDQQARYAQELYQRNKNVYIPQADKIIADANAFDKAGYGAQQAGLAMGDLQSAYAVQHQQNLQNLAQYGISPTSGRAMAMDSAGAVNNAASAASAATRARMAAEELWGTKQVNAMNTANTLNANANAYAGLNAGAGSLYTNANNVRGQGFNATSQYFTNADSLAKTAANTYTSANNAYSSAGNLALGQSKIDNDRYMAEQQGRGTILGAGLQALNGSGSSSGSSSGGSGTGSGLNLVKDVYNTGKTIVDWGSKLFS